VVWGWARSRKNLVHSHSVACRKTSPSSNGARKRGGKQWGGNETIGVTKVQIARNTERGLNRRKKEPLTCGKFQKQAELRDAPRERGTTEEGNKMWGVFR